MNSTPKFVADLANVQEVALLGSVDPDYWAERLAAESLCPILRDGRAQLLITAAAGVFKGLRFREVSLSVLAVDPDWPDRQGALLVHAFNSSRLLAWCERFWFHTPYWPATIDLRWTPQAGVQVRTPTGGRLELAMSSASDARQLTRCGPGGWQGFVYLPSSTRQGKTVRRWFFVLIEGATSTFAASPGDVWAASAVPDARALQDLIDSRIQPREWQIRTSARHARSKTFLRDWPSTGPELCGEQGSA